MLHLQLWTLRVKKQSNHTRTNATKRYKTCLHPWRAESCRLERGFCTLKGGQIGLWNAFILSGGLMKCSRPIRRPGLGSTAFCREIFVQPPHKSAQISKSQQSFAEIEDELCNSYVHLSAFVEVVSQVVPHAHNPVPPRNLMESAKPFLGSACYDCYESSATKQCEKVVADMTSQWMFRQASWDLPCSGTAGTMSGNNKPKASW